MGVDEHNWRLMLLGLDGSIFARSWDRMWCPAVNGKRCLDVWTFDEVLWNVVPTDAAVIADEDPCMLLVSACHELGKLVQLGIDAARVEGQPQQRGFVSFGTVPAWTWGHHRELGSADEVCGGRLWKSRRCGALRRRRSGAAAPRSRCEPGRYSAT